MVRIDTDYIDYLKYEAIHGPSQNRVQTAAPVDNQGDGSSFSPTDLLATAMLTCMQTILQQKANALQVDVSGMHGSVEKHMASAPRRVQRLVISLNIPREFDPSIQEQLYRAAVNCPVAKSVHPEMELETVIQFGR